MDADLPLDRVPPATPRAAVSRSTSSPLYPYTIAPFWWIDSTSAAYAAIKYVNVVIVYYVAAVPTQPAALGKARQPPRRHVVAALVIGGAQGWRT